MRKPAIIYRPADFRWRPRNPCTVRVGHNEHTGLAAYVLIDADGREFAQCRYSGPLDVEAALRGWDHMYHQKIELEEGSAMNPKYDGKPFLYIRCGKRFAPMDLKRNVAVINRMRATMCTIEGKKQVEEDLRLPENAHLEWEWRK